MLPDWLLYGDRYPLDIFDADGKHSVHVRDQTNFPDDMNVMTAVICEVSAARTERPVTRTDKNISLWVQKVHRRQDDMQHSNRRFF